MQVFREMYANGTLPIFDSVFTFSSVEHSGLGERVLLYCNKNVFCSQCFFKLVVQLVQHFRILVIFFFICLFH